MVGAVCHSFESVLCVLQILVYLSDRAFISSGFNNWKKALQRFEQHAQSNVHKEALLRIELMEQPTVLSQLSNQLKD